MGGVQVDKNLRVVGTNGKPIPGLYAVGEVADDGLFGTGPTHINVYYGKKAAENVLAEEKLR
ncbi:FAD-binding protein [Parasutterella sp. NM82_D38]|uniref:FAD-binding protein n=1 Tax=Parasutterella muris TaxID=2565572 RepID=A0A6L6YHV8_9BURK|nr:FAD-binding protein [Parasutterella muris]